MKTKIFSSLLSFLALGVLWCCSVLSVSAQVQTDHYYIISNVSNGKVLSTGGKDAKDAPLVGETLQKNSPSQLWQLKKVEPDAVALYNPFAELAVDLAIQAQKGPLLWSLDVTNPNQQLILEQEGENFRLRAASYQY